MAITWECIYGKENGKDYIKILEKEKHQKFSRNICDNPDQEKSEKENDERKIEEAIEAAKEKETMIRTINMKNSTPKKR